MQTGGCADAPNAWVRGRGAPRAAVIHYEANGSGERHRPAGYGSSEGTASVRTSNSQRCACLGHVRRSNHWAMSAGVGVCSMCTRALARAYTTRRVVQKMCQYLVPVVRLGWVVFSCRVVSCRVRRRLLPQLAQMFCSGALVCAESTPTSPPAHRTLIKPRSVHCLPAHCLRRRPCMRPVLSPAPRIRRSSLIVMDDYLPT